MQIAHIEVIEMIILGVIGTLLWVLIICSATKRKIKFLLIPYFFLAVFSAKVYFSAHHLGIVFMFFLFWGVYISQEEDKYEIGNALIARIAVKKSDYTLIKYSYFAVGIVCMVIPMVWTAEASVHDVRYEYNYGKSTAQFLEENYLSDLLILGSWHDNSSLVPLSENNEGYVNTVMIGTAVPVNAYFNQNVFYNLNHGNPQKGYIYHRWPSLEESANDLELWRSYGAPDVIVGNPNLKQVYGTELSYRDYKLVAVIETKNIWKATLTTMKMPIFLRNDLLEEYHLEALEGIEYTSINGIRITEDMRERYNNGEPWEEILKPYLDAIFGEEIIK